LRYIVGRLVSCTNFGSVLANLVCGDANINGRDLGLDPDTDRNAALHSFEPRGFLVLACVAGDDLGHHIGLAGACFRQSFESIARDNARYGER